jgi:hypothetical protein
MAVPTVYLNGEAVRPGPHDARRNRRQARYRRLRARRRKLNAKKAPYDVLVVGGGPAGSAAAIYAARKGIRTGVVAERFGGQVLDTLGIENFISVQLHRGPQAGHGAGAARQGLRSRHHEPAARRRWFPPANPPMACTRSSWPTAPRSRPRRDPRHRRALARDERARREGIQGQGRLPSARTATARCSRASAWR